MIISVADQPGEKNTVKQHTRGLVFLIKLKCYISVTLKIYATARYKIEIRAFCHTSTTTSKY